MLDEPFTLLDVDGVALLGEVLRELAAGGTAVLVSSHQLDLLEELCDGVVIVDKGRLVVAGRVEELRAAAQQVMRLRFAAPSRFRSPRPHGADASCWRKALGEVPTPERVGEMIARGIRTGKEAERRLAKESTGRR